MSLENDITTIKTLLEDGEPVFKPASDSNLSKRREERAKRPLIPVDPQARDLDEQYWTLHNKLVDRLDTLRYQYGFEECECDNAKIDLAGEEYMITDVVGDSW